MKVVYISFSFRDIERKNSEDIRAYFKYALKEGVLPINPISIAKELQEASTHKKGIFNKRLELIKRCDEVWVFQEKIQDNMIQDVNVAKRHNIPVKFIDLRHNMSKAERLQRYKIILKKVNDYIYSANSNKFDPNYFNKLHGEIMNDSYLTKDQKFNFLFKIQDISSDEENLRYGHKYVWNLNKHVRSTTAYKLTMVYIEKLEMGEKKMFLMKKLFETIKSDKIALETHKKNIIGKIFDEIRRHSENPVLEQIYKYEDIYDLVETFLKD